MNNNSDAVTAGDIVFLGVCIAGVLTGLTGVVTTTPAASLVGLGLLFVGLAYFAVLQAVDA